MNHSPQFALPGFNHNIYQEGGGGLGSIFSAVSRILLPNASILVPKVARGITQFLGDVLADHVEDTTRQHVERIRNRSRNNNIFQTGRGRPKKQSKTSSVKRGRKSKVKKRKRKRKKLSTSSKTIKNHVRQRDQLNL